MFKAVTPLGLKKQLQQHLFFNFMGKVVSLESAPAISLNRDFSV